jgi:hypothetical protein
MIENDELKALIERELETDEGCRPNAVCGDYVDGIYDGRTEAFQRVLVMIEEGE